MYYWCTNSLGTIVHENGNFTCDIQAAGNEEWNVKLTQAPIALVNGKKYHFSFDIVSSSNRKVKYVFQNLSTYAWYGGETLELTAGEKKTIDYTIDVKGDAMPTCNSVNFILNMGILHFYGANGLEGTYTPDSSAVIKVSNFSLVEINE